MFEKEFVTRWAVRHDEHDGRPAIAAELLIDRPNNKTLRERANNNLKLEWWKCIASLAKINEDKWNRSRNIWLRIFVNIEAVEQWLSCAQCDWCCDGSCDKLQILRKIEMLKSKWASVGMWAWSKEVLELTQPRGYGRINCKKFDFMLKFKFVFKSIFCVGVPSFSVVHHQRRIGIGQHRLHMVDERSIE